MDMGLRNFFKNSSNEIYTQNKELLEEYGLLNTVGNPNKICLKFLKSKNIDVNKDEITDDLINEFFTSKDSVDVELARIQKQKNTIFKQRKVWINIYEDDELIGTDLLLDHEGISIQKTAQRILYSQMEDIEINEGGWSKNKFIIKTSDEDVVFEINEERTLALKEILEDNMENSHRNEIDDLIELYDLLEQGKISEDEFEIRKNAIYSDDLYCTQCGEKIDTDSEFCSNCGSKTE